MPLWVDNPLAEGAQPTIHVTCQPHGTEIVSTGFRGSRRALLVMLLQVATEVAIQVDLERGQGDNAGKGT